jgi:hypothetical protein
MLASNGLSPAQRLTLVGGWRFSNMNWLLWAAAAAIFTVTVCFFFLRSDDYDPRD